MAAHDAKDGGVRRVLVPDAEIERVLKLAKLHGLTLAGLDVGRDYVRLIPPANGSDSIEAFIDRPAHSPKKAGGR